MVDGPAKTLRQFTTMKCALSRSIDNNAEPFDSNNWDEGVGHAGALIRAKEGTLTGGFDRRSDGAVEGF